MRTRRRCWKRRREFLGRYFQIERNFWRISTKKNSLHNLYSVSKAKTPYGKKVWDAESNFISERAKLRAKRGDERGNESWKKFEQYDLDYDFRVLFWVEFRKKEMLQQRRRSLPKVCWTRILCWFVEWEDVVIVWHEIAMEAAKLSCLTFIKSNCQSIMEPHYNVIPSSCERVSNLRLYPRNCMIVFNLKITMNYTVFFRSV